MKHFSHLNTAVQLIEQYKGELPFSVFIKSFFAQHKKFGSKDRKAISNFCYSFFRLGHALRSIPVEERILIASFLCNQLPAELLKPGWRSEANIDEKISMFPFSLQDIFPWKDLLSDGIDHEQLCRSFLIQPDLFLRLRPGHEDIVKQKLTGFNEISPTCLALPNASKIDIELDKEAVVQDRNSQLTIKEVNGNVWDCCAASGGKSILAYDLDPSIHLTVSDVRESIIHNLKKRFARAGIKNYRAFIADISKNIIHEKFDTIICDAPCSGSGTWSRTPEQLYFFHPSKIDHYSTLQRKIIANAIRSLKPGGKFIYITCSVFKQENEDIAVSMQKEVLKGYDKKADSLFVAVKTND
ncbi:MAG TPA: methyltransferase domain-containing protein [Chitinophagaceae bacterium]|nr:methyltransferase domain-containing protein [Chitinophagaceae bacterium]